MKRLTLLSVLVALLTLTAAAKNTTQTVEQVTEAVSLTDDVDYHISSTSPFTADGSIDIVNTDHAVVIFDNLKPSKVTSYLTFIKINGKKATNGSNCQLKLYNRGAILLPYGGTLFRPLTVFDDKNCEGESSTAFTEGHSGGYMKNVPNSWNNRIRSFRLKRGYMVTFALKKGGKGYSRCFIADDSDLEVNLTNLMDQRISSYRIFKWYDASKAAIADIVDANVCRTLNVSSTFTWSKGSSLLPDAECVPHHIKENWPTAADCGNQDYSCHLKTNNEPRNTADDSPCDLEDILANWEDLMRTGLRLCTPSSWDGSDYWNATGFLADFLTEIDKRGWRCDIIDLHGYWNEGSFSTNTTNWSQKFKRPIWISEWVWGASWSGGSGIFVGTNLDNPTAADLQKNKDAVQRITTTLNDLDFVERYFYWNGERNVSKLYRNGLTPAGEYYANMETPLAYNGSVNYIPSAPPTNPASDLAATFYPSTSICRLQWTPLNGDLAETISLQRRIGSEAWETIQTWNGGDVEERSTIVYNDTIKEPGAYTYRVQEKIYNGSTETSNTVTNTLAVSSGTADVQFGTISSTPMEEAYTYFAYPFSQENKPIVVCGSVSNKNTGIGLVDNVMAINSIDDQYTNFQYRMNRWFADDGSTASSRETSNFIAAKPGNGKIGSLAYEAGYVKDADGNENIGFEATEVRFTQPFATVPVVMIAPILNTTAAKPCMWRVWDVTTEGFKMALMLESNITSGKTARPVGYFAIEKGTASNGAGTLFCVGDTTLTFKSAAQKIIYPMELQDPQLMVQFQSYDYEAAAILRISTSTSPTTDGRVRMQVDKSNTDMTLSSSRSATEKIGYIVLSTDPNFDSIHDVKVNGKSNNDIYDLSGRRMSSPIGKGIYIVGGKKVVVK